MPFFTGHRIGLLTDSIDIFAQQPARNRHLRETSPQITRKFLQANPMENGPRIEADSQITFHRSFRIRFGKSARNDVFTGGMAKADGMNIGSRATDVPKPKITPSFFILFSLGAQ